MTLTPQGLVETVAYYLGLPESRVKNYDRKLMEAGLRTKKGHGRGSAIMTMNDAAMLLIAIASTDQVNDAVTTATYVRDFPLHESADATPLLELINADTRGIKKFGPALCEVMNYLASNDDPKDTLLALRVTLAAEVPVWARIVLHDKRKGVLDIDYSKKVPVYVRAAGLQIERSILMPAIQTIAKRVAGVASEAAA
jgi:hypothetical protein